MTVPVRWVLCAICDRVVIFCAFQLEHFPINWRLPVNTLLLMVLSIITITVLGVVAIFR